MRPTERIGRRKEKGEGSEYNQNITNSYNVYIPFYTHMKLSKNNLKITLIFNVFVLCSFFQKEDR